MPFGWWTEQIARPKISATDHRLVFRKGSSITIVIDAILEFAPQLIESPHRRRPTDGPVRKVSDVVPAIVDPQDVSTRAQVLCFKLCDLRPRAVGGPPGDIQCSKEEKAPSTSPVDTHCDWCGQEMDCSVCPCGAR